MFDLKISHSPVKITDMAQKSLLILTCIRNRRCKNMQYKILKLQIHSLLFIDNYHSSLNINQYSGFVFKELEGPLGRYQTERGEFLLLSCLHLSGMRKRER